MRMGSTFAAMACLTSSHQRSLQPLPPAGLHAANHHVHRAAGSVTSPPMGLSGTASSYRPIGEIGHHRDAAASGSVGGRDLMFELSWRMQQWSDDTWGDQGPAGGSSGGAGVSPTASFNGCVFSALKALSLGEESAFRAAVSSAAALLAGGVGRRGAGAYGESEGGEGGPWASGSSSLPLRCRMVGLLGDAGSLRWQKVGSLGAAGEEAAARGAPGPCLAWLGIPGRVSGAAEYAGTVEPLMAMACR